jgi:hypothetical protein
LKHKIAGNVLIGRKELNKERRLRLNHHDASSNCSETFGIWSRGKHAEG